MGGLPGLDHSLVPLASMSSRPSASVEHLFSGNQSSKHVTSRLTGCCLWKRMTSRQLFMALR